MHCGENIYRRDNLDDRCVRLFRRRTAQSILFRFIVSQLHSITAAHCAEEVYVWSMLRFTKRGLNMSINLMNWSLLVLNDHMLCFRSEIYITFGSRFWAQASRKRVTGMWVQTKHLLYRVSKIYISPNTEIIERKKQYLRTFHDLFHRSPETRIVHMTLCLI